MFSNLRAHRIMTIGAVAVLVILTAGFVQAQLPIPGPPGPIQPPDPIGPPEPPEPEPPRGPRDPGPGRGNESGDIRIYDGFRTVDLVFEIERRGNELQVFSGQRSRVPSMTMKGNRIFDGRRLNLDATIATVRGNRVIPGTTTDVRRATCTIVGTRFFDGFRTDMSNLKFTLQGSSGQHRLYEGRSTGRLTNAMWTIEGRLDDNAKALIAVLADC